MLLLVCASCCFLHSAFHSPQPAEDAKKMDETGTLEGVAAGKLQIKNAKAEVWNVSLANNAKVMVSGTAEADFLKAGLTVKFSADLDEKGAFKGEDVSEIEIFTPQGKTSLGLFPQGSDSDAKPLKKIEAGSYDIRGQDRQLQRQ